MGDGEDEEAVEGRDVDVEEGGDEEEGIDVEDVEVDGEGEVEDGSGGDAGDGEEGRGSVFAGREGCGKVDSILTDTCISFVILERSGRLGGREEGKMKKGGKGEKREKVNNIGKSYHLITKICHFGTQKKIVFFFFRNTFFYTMLSEEK